MLYSSAAAWRAATHKRVIVFGMSGLGKTHVSNMLRAGGGWFHYSIDYRIGTRYMGEHIVDNFKAEAMRNPFLAKLLRTDSIYIASNITFNNLAPLSTYLGKPGDPAKGGIPYDEYLRRQELHRQAEVSALLDTVHFIERAERLYGYANFIGDTGGSICEVVDPWDTSDAVMSTLAQNALMIWIEGSDAHTQSLVRRFDQNPKPMYYQREFLDAAWAEYRGQRDLAPDEVDPDDFVRWAYARAMAHRQPRYAQMAKNWGITLSADQVAGLESEADFDDVIAAALA